MQECLHAPLFMVHDASWHSQTRKGLLVFMISCEMCDQLKPLRVAVAPSVGQRFIDGDKEMVSLSPIIYLVDGITFFDAAQL